MQCFIERLIGASEPKLSKDEEVRLDDYLSQLFQEAFVAKKEAARLQVHRLLYRLNSAHLGAPWEGACPNLGHPLIAGIKYKIEKAWEAADRQTYRESLEALPSNSEFPAWVKTTICKHPSNGLHPIFPFLKCAASMEQMREFFFQETPLEMLFGDILSFMLPGTYGSIKMEFLNNYWDEVGRGQAARVHRNLRADLMQHLQIQPDAYLKNSDLLIVEELELINLYLSLATSRSKHTELAGVMLATELVVTDRFQDQIAGWKRLGLEDPILSYLSIHAQVDEKHAQDWLEQVVMPMMFAHPHAKEDLILGVMRRLDAAIHVLDALYARLEKLEVACVGKYV